MTGQIDIGTVLNKFNDTVDDHTHEVKTFGIRFLKADGSIRTMIARKNVKQPKTGFKPKANEKGKLNYNLQYNGVMLLTDTEANGSRAVKTSMIFGFRDHRSSTWLNVRH